MDMTTEERYILQLRWAAQWALNFMKTIEWDGQVTETEASDIMTALDSALEGLSE
jgi:hypothetical protein